MPKSIAGGNHPVLGSEQAYTAATATQVGCQVTGTYWSSAAVPLALNISGVGQTVPNGQDANIYVAPDAAGVVAGQTYLFVVEPSSGNRCFGIDSELSDVMYFVQNPDWNGRSNFQNLTPAITATQCDFDPLGDDTGVPGNGSPTINWHVLK